MLIIVIYSFFDFITSAILETLVALFSTFFAVYKSIKLKRAILMLKVAIAFWTSWIIMAVIFAFSGKIGWGFGPYSAFDNYLKLHPTIRSVFNVFVITVSLCIRIIPFVLIFMLVSAFVKKKRNQGNRIN